MSILTFRLEGVMQSWGDHAKWNRRDTNDFPTKSGIVGLIACCCGWERNDKRIVDLSQKISIAVRADRKGISQTDFHMVTDKFNTIRRASDRSPKTSGGIVSYRDYLHDASFLVVVEASEETLNMIKNAFYNPVWAPYLGRKSCSPSVPILGEIHSEYTSLIDAVENEPLIERHDKDIIQYEIEDLNGEYYLTDEIYNVNNREYYRRCVSRGTIDISNAKK